MCGFHEVPSRESQKGGKHEEEGSGISARVGGSFPLRERGGKGRVDRSPERKEGRSKRPGMNGQQP